jgi:hypothetical protein
VNKSENINFLNEMAVLGLLLAISMVFATFYILAAGRNDGDHYVSSVYDTSTIDKITQVLVTVVYNIE